MRPFENDYRGRPPPMDYDNRYRQGDRPPFDRYEQDYRRGGFQDDRPPFRGNDRFNRGPDMDRFRPNDGFDGEVSCRTQLVFAFYTVIESINIFFFLIQSWRRGHRPPPPPDMPPYRERGMSGEFGGRPGGDRYPYDRPGGGFMGRPMEREVDEKQIQREIIEAARYEAELLKMKASESKTSPEQQSKPKQDESEKHESMEEGHEDDHRGGPMGRNGPHDRHGPPQMNAWERRGPAHDLGPRGGDREPWVRGGRDNAGHGPSHGGDFHRGSGPRSNHPPMEHRVPERSSWERGAPIINPDPKMRYEPF